MYFQIIVIILSIILEKFNENAHSVFIHSIKVSILLQIKMVSTLVNIKPYFNTIFESAATIDFPVHLLNQFLIDIPVHSRFDHE